MFAGGLGLARFAETTRHKYCLKSDGFKTDIQDLGHAVNGGVWMKIKVRLARNDEPQVTRPARVNREIVESAQILSSEFIDLAQRAGR